MKKSAALFLLTSVFTISAYADDFDFSSINQCKKILETYSDSANDLAWQKPITEDRVKGFGNLSFALFKLSEDANMSGESCSGGQCTSFASANCSLSLTKVFWDKVKPLLDKEINQYLKNNQYDPGLPATATYSVRCYYPEGHRSTDKCELVLDTSPSAKSH